jgi:SAM-dependent methyltransferase
MPWTWIRPADPSLLEGRPLLDLGTGDGQTLGALVSPDGLVVGVDRFPLPLRAAAHATKARLAVATVDHLPFRDGTLGTVLAADLFHHLDDGALEETLMEVGRVIRPGGRIVAWWYEKAARPGPDAPRFPRPLTSVVPLLTQTGFQAVEELALEFDLEPAPATVGIAAAR